MEIAGIISYKYAGIYFKVDQNSEVDCHEM